ncbi:TetR/AcrR family transcriptional regulator [Aneurinibacillus uraniidurans]|uniref:TetR/AcrR family transcriptional regulator n=1 Tax=Aneurinibacillus uraniidurans TaxID=2966586 RepID=UPI00234BBD2F|nr:TetR/AcrR family transcriptional regulator [Aneurinibacillus sp. B1]WCN36347.1 TetR/AcrR family transcriptional regulator [Aneurinibacillus sp. B1]
MTAFKREELLEAASRVIALKGLDKLTLDAVAAEAGVSKGGLMYHFPNKQALITAMNHQVITRFQQEIEREQDKAPAGRGAFIRAYASATLTDLSDCNYLDTNTGILAAMATNHELLSAWRDVYEEWGRALRQEDVKPELALIVRLVCDGLWFSKMFALDPLTPEEQQSVMQYLFEKIEKGE